MRGGGGNSSPLVSCFLDLGTLERILTFIVVAVVVAGWLTG